MTDISSRLRQKEREELRADFVRRKLELVKDELERFEHYDIDKVKIIIGKEL